MLGARSTAGGGDERGQRKKAVRAGTTHRIEGPDDVVILQELPQRRRRLQERGRHKDAAGPQHPADLRDLHPNAAAACSHGSGHSSPAQSIQLWHHRQERQRMLRLTAAVGFGQQWRAAPACRAATEPVRNGRRPTSALSSKYCLHASEQTPDQASTACLEGLLPPAGQHHSMKRHARLDGRPCAGQRMPASCCPATDSVRCSGCRFTGRRDRLTGRPAGGQPHTWDQGLGRPRRTAWPA